MCGSRGGEGLCNLGSCRSMEFPHRVLRKTGERHFTAIWTRHPRSLGSIRSRRFRIGHECVTGDCIFWIPQLLTLKVSIPLLDTCIQLTHCQPAFIHNPNFVSGADSSNTSTICSLCYHIIVLKRTNPSNAGNIFKLSL